MYGADARQYAQRAADTKRVPTDQQSSTSCRVKRLQDHEAGGQKKERQRDANASKGRGKKRGGFDSNVGRSGLCGETLGSSRAMCDGWLLPISGPKN